MDKALLLVLTGCHVRTINLFVCSFLKYPCETVVRRMAQVSHVHGSNALRRRAYIKGDTQLFDVGRI